MHETVYFFCERTCKYISSDFELTLLSRCMIVSIYNCHCRMWRSTVMLQTQIRGEARTWNHRDQTRVWTVLNSIFPLIWRISSGSGDPNGKAQLRPWNKCCFCFHNGNGAVPGAYLSKKKCKYIVQEVKVLKATLIIFLHKCNTKGGATLEMSAYLLVAYGRTENIRIHMYTFIWQYRCIVP